MLRNRGLLLLLLIPAVCLDLPRATAQQTAEAAKAHIERDVVYGHGGDRELKLDIARPEGDGPFPALIFIHGGGWRGGNRQSFFPFVRFATQRGYVAATITYRLTEPDGNGKAKHPFPAAVHDAKCAVRWLRANAETWHVDPQRIGVAGGSAGGHLALMVGLTDPKSQLDGNGGHADQSSRVQAVVNFFGPTEMVQGYSTTDNGKPLLESFLVGKPEENPDNYRNASPLTWISKDDPPVLTFHGGKDTLVPPEQAKLLDERMQAAGVPHTLVIYETEGHGFSIELMNESIEKMFVFFDEQLKNEQPQ